MLLWLKLAVFNFFASFVKKILVFDSPLPSAMFLDAFYHLFRIFYTYYYITSDIILFLAFYIYLHFSTTDIKLLLFIVSFLKLNHY